MLRKRRLLIWIGTLLLILIVVSVGSWLLFDVTITFSRQRPIDQLAAAKLVWQTHQLADYRMWIRLSSVRMVGTYKISVKDNRVESVQDGHLQICDNCALKEIDPQAVTAYEDAFGKFFPSTVTDLTMDSLFILAADKLKDEPAPPFIAICSAVDTDQWRYEASYDDVQGYITALRYTNCPRTGGGGLLCSAVSDCSAEIAISRLQAQK